MSARPRVYSRLTRDALALLGKQIKLARKARRMTELELAERVGVARSTLQRIEKGDGLVEIGLVLEAATIAGVPLFVPEATSLRPELARLDDKLTLLPRAVRKPQGRVDNDF